jgi:CheY-like chemotaxis protein
MDATARLLVVDDEHVNRRLLGGALEKEGYTVEVAVDGRDALAKLATSRFDLVLLDIEMPEVGGIEVLERMKAEPSLQQIPVIIVSAHEELARIVQCIELGATDYLPKPFDPVLMRARVRSALAQFRLNEVMDTYGHASDDRTVPSSRSGLRTASPTLDASVTEGSVTVDMRGALPSTSDEDRTEPRRRPITEGAGDSRRWTRVSLTPGIELHVSDAVAVPANPGPREAWTTTLLERMRAELEKL